MVYVRHKRTLCPACLDFFMAPGPEFQKKAESADFAEANSDVDNFILLLEITPQPCDHDSLK